MIYRTSYFRKELRQAHSEYKTGLNRKISFALFVGLLSFALYFVFQTVQESVLAEVLPEIMQPSFFSTLYIYIHLAFLLNTVYFIIYYDYLFFSEIRKNSWYLLVQMRYNPVMMIFAKLSALLLSVLLIYTIGFVFTIFLTIFLKYNFIFAYMPALYFAGLFDLVLLSFFAMTLSLHVKTVTNARYWCFFAALFIFLLKVGLNFYTLLSNRAAMQNFMNLFDFSQSWFLLVASLMLLACILICILGARNIARYYSLSHNMYTVYPEKRVVYIDSETGAREEPIIEESKVLRSKIAEAAFTVLLIGFICSALAFNIFVILINAATPGSEVTIRGVIPFVFKSDTMEPDIMLNDLAYFRKVDEQYPIKKGQIILFRQNSVIYVERVIDKKEDQLIADIDKYPPMSQPKAMLKTVRREEIIGVYSGRNRWLGALILFANTIIGRLLFLLVPAILLFYHKQIVDLLKRKRQG